MTQIDLISNEWSDLLFENRNKEYGAYVLRHQTGNRNLASILAILVFVAAIVSLLVIKNEYDRYVAKHTVVVYDQGMVTSNLKNKAPEVKRAEPIRRENIEEVVEKIKCSIKFTAPVIKKDDEVDPKDEMRTQDEIMKSKVSISVFDVLNGSEDGEVLKAKQMLVTEPVKPKVEENKVFEYVEQMPSFPGGEAALMQYLSKNIKYPPFAETTRIASLSREGSTLLAIRISLTLPSRSTTKVHITRP